MRSPIDGRTFLIRVTHDFKRFGLRCRRLLEQNPPRLWLASGSMGNKANCPKDRKDRQVFSSELLPAVALGVPKGLPVSWRAQIAKEYKEKE